ncbi:hypothetical protein GLYMA_16G083350v4 [Glycine max]|nr:hypothetical protein GLYMA_16G083350v4 [Glycine max]KAH1150510.1 hypothetical protein GYH30_044496 [Glycine max]
MRSKRFTKVPKMLHLKMLCLVVDLRTNQVLQNMLIMWVVNSGMT